MNGLDIQILIFCIGFLVQIFHHWCLSVLGAFLIPYIIMLALAGKPMYFLELAIGQFGGVGPLALWNCCPIMKGEFRIILTANKI